MHPPLQYRRPRPTWAGCLRSLSLQRVEPAASVSLSAPNPHLHLHLRLQPLLPPQQQHQQPVMLVLAPLVR